MATAVPFLCIDIGSNSIRCMQADGVFSHPRFSAKRVFTTRLAEGLAASGLLSKERMQDSLAVLRALAAEADAAGMPMRAYATSAVRDAENRDAFLRPAERLLHAGVRVLSGREEAAFARLAACGDDPAMGLIDIGGGSTQISCGDFAESFPIGCVRARDRFGDATFATLSASMRPALDGLYALPAFPETAWAGVGGTITTLGALLIGLSAYDSRAVQHFPIVRDALESTLLRLSDIGDDARASIPLLCRRHDVILHGGALLLYLMDRIGIPALRVSDTDGLEGYARSLLPR